MLCLIAGPKNSNSISNEDSNFRLNNFCIFKKYTWNLRRKLSLNLCYNSQRINSDTISLHDIESAIIIYLKGII